MASKSITSSGIRIPVELDTTRARKEAVKLGTDFASVLKEVNAQFKDVGSGGTLIDMRKFTSAITQIQTQALKARDAVDSIGQIKNIDKIIQSSSQSAEAFTKLSKVIGVTEKDLQSFYRQALNKQAVNDQIAAMKGIESSVDGSRESILAFSKAVGVSQEAMAKYKFKSALFDLRDIDVATEQVKKFDSASRLSEKTTQELAGALQKLTADAKRVQEAGEFFKTANGDIQLFTRAMKEAGYSSKEIGEALRTNLDIAGTSLSNVRKSIDTLNPSLKLNKEEYDRVSAAVRTFVEENERVERTKQVAALVNNNIDALKGLAAQFGLTTEDVKKFEKAQRGVAALNLSNLSEAIEYVKRLGTSSNLSSGTINELAKSFQKLSVDAERVKEAGVYFKAANGDVEKFTKTLREAGFTSEEVNRLLEKNFKGVENSTQAAKNAIDAINPALKLNADEYNRAVSSVSKYIEESRRIEYVKEVASLVNNNAVALRGLSSQFKLTTDDIKKFEQAQRGASSVDFRNIDNAANYIRSLDSASKLSEKTINELAKSLQQVTIDKKKVSDASEFFITANKDAALFTRALKEAGYSSKEIGDALRKNLDNASSAIQKARVEIDKLNPTLKNNKEEYARVTEQVSKFIAQNNRLEYTKGVAKLVNNDVEMLRKLSTQFKLTEKDILEFINAQEKANKSRGLMGIFSPTSMAAGVQSGLAAMGVSFGAYGLVEFGRSAIQTSMQMEAITTAFESIYGSADKAAEKLKFIRKVSDDLGLSFVQTAQEAKKVFASAEAAGLGEQANKIFMAFSNAGAALKLTSDEMSSVYLAISQIMSKGKVSAEEMNQQLAERLPGATTMLAKSMNVTSIELFKMFEQGKVTLDHFVGFADELNRKYSSAAKSAAHTTQAELNRATTAWQMFKDAIVDTGTVGDALAGLTDSLNSITNAINGLSPENLENWKSFLSILAAASAGGAAAGLAGSITGIGAAPAAVVGATAAGGYELYSQYVERAKETTKVLEEQDLLLRQRVQLEDKIAEAAIVGNNKVKLAYQDQLNAIDARLRDMPQKYKAVTDEIIGQMHDSLSKNQTTMQWDITSMAPTFFTKDANLFKDQLEQFEKLTRAFRDTKDIEAYATGLELLKGDLELVGGASSDVLTKIENLVSFLKQYAGYTVKMKVQVDVTPTDKIRSEVDKFLAETESAVKGSKLAKVAGLEKEVENINEMIKKNQTLIDKLKASGSSVDANAQSDAYNSIVKLQERGVQLTAQREQKQKDLNSLIEDGTRKEQAAQLKTTELKEKGIALTARTLDLQAALSSGAEGVERKRQAADLRYQAQIQKLQQDKNVALEKSTSEKDKQLITDNAAAQLEVLRLEHALAIKDINERNAKTSASAYDKQEKATKILASELKKSQEDLASITTTNLDGLNKSNRAVELANQKYKEQITSIKQAAEAERARYAKNPEAQSLINQKEKIDLLILEKKYNQDLITLEENKLNQTRKDAKDRAQFYKELQKYSNQYSESLLDQNIIIEEQMARWRLVPGLREEELQVLEKILRLEASRTGEAGFTRATQKYLVEAEDVGKSMEDIFSSLYKGIEQSSKAMWADFIENGKVSMNSLKSIVKNFIAELSYELLLKPIQVQLIASVAGSLGGVGTASAGGVSGGGGSMNTSLLSSMLPKDFFSKITDPITSGVNNYMAKAFPSLFGTGGATFAGTGGALTSGTLSTAGINSITGAGYGGMASQTFTGALSNAFGAGGLASMGTGFMNSLLGVDEKTSMLTSAASGLTTGALALAGVNPLVGIPVAVLSSLAGKLFGKKKPKRPAVWGGVEMNLGDETAFNDYDFGATFDPKNYGRDQFEVYDSGNFAVATKSRNKASSDVAKAMNQLLREVGLNAVEQVKTIQTALPDSYSTAFKEHLSKYTVSAEWDFKGDEINEESFKKAAQELQDKINESVLLAFQDMDFSGYADKITVDQSSVEGLDRFIKALQLTEQAIDAVKEIKDPMSEIEQQAKAANAQLVEWTKSMEQYGVTAEYAKKLVDDYREALIDKFIDDMDKAVNPISEYTQAMENANKAIDNRIEALKLLGASEDQLAQVEALRAGLIQNTVEPMRTEFNNEFKMREAQLAGNDALIQATQTLIDQEQELAEIRSRFGEDSIEYIMMQDLHLREYAALQKEIYEQLNRTAISVAESLKSMDVAISNTLNSLVQSITTRAATAYGRTDESALLSMKYQHQNELTEARRQAISLTDDMLIRAKTEAMNRGETLTPGQEGKIWSPDEVLESIKSAGMTVQQWFEQYGKNEGFGDIGAGYTNTAYEDALRAVQAVELANLKLEQAKKASEDAQRAVATAKSAYDSILSNIQGLVRQLKSVAEEFKNAADALRDARVKMWEGTGNLNPESRLQSTKSEFDRLYQEAMSGDAKSAEELAAMGDSLLALYKETATSSEEYMDAFYNIDQLLKAAQEAQEKAYHNAKSEYDLLVLQYDLQEDQSLTQEAILERIKAQKEDLAEANRALLEAENLAANARERQIAAQEEANKAMAEQAKILQKSIEVAQAAANAALAAANRPTSSGGGGGGSSGGGSINWPSSGGSSSGKSQMQILQEKADAMNKGQTLSGNQTQGGWTPSKVLSDIEKAGESFNSWYNKYGKGEGFASGGITPVNFTSWSGKQTPFWTGERGPELVVSPQQYGVVNSRASKALLGTDSDNDMSAVCAVLTSLLAETTMVRNDVGSMIRQVVITLNNIRSDTRAINDQFDEIITEGLDVHPIGGVA